MHSLDTITKTHGRLVGAARYKVERAVSGASPTLPIPTSEVQETATDLFVSTDIFSENCCVEDAHRIETQQMATLFLAGKRRDPFHDERKPEVAVNKTYMSPFRALGRVPKESVECCCPPCDSNWARC